MRSLHWYCANVLGAECRLWVIRVAPTGSKASPNVRYDFNGDQILCVNEPTHVPEGDVGARGSTGRDRRAD